MKIPQYSDERLLFGMILSTANKLQMIGDKMYNEITMKQFVVLIMLKVFEEEHMNNLFKEVDKTGLKQAVQVMLQLTKNLEEMGNNESKGSSDLSI